MTTRRVLETVAIIAVFVIAMAFFFPSYWVRSYYGGGQALWREGELYVVVGIKTVGVRQSKVTELLGAVGLPVTPMPTPLREDLVVFHLSGQESQAYKLRGFPAGVHLVPAQDGLYASLGCAEGPCPVWKWQGTEFQALPPEAGEAVRKETGMIRAAIERMGWQSYDTRMTFQDRPVRLPLPGVGAGAELLLTSDPSRVLKMVAVQEASRTMAVQTFDETWRRVGKAEYAAEVGHVQVE